MAEKLGRISERDLRKLPRWARVAFAARCARRVQALFRKYRPEAPEESATAIEIAIGLAEMAAAHAQPGTGQVEAATAAHKAAATALGGEAGERTRSSKVKAADFVPWAVAHAAAFAAEAAEDGGTSDIASQAAAIAFGLADRAAHIANAVDARAGMRRDLRFLRESATAEEWTDLTPVARELFETA